VVFMQQPAVGMEPASAAPVQPQNERPNLGQITGTRPAFSLAGLSAVKLKPFTPRVGTGAASSTVPYGAPAPPATPAAEATEGNPDVCRQLFPAQQAPMEVDGAELALAAPVSAPAAAPAAANVAAAIDEAEDKENGGATKANALAPAGEEC
jgi:hypothetical protein